MIPALTPFLLSNMEKAVVMTGLAGRHGTELMVAMHRIR
jgi:hypothetical protein